MDKYELPEFLNPNDLSNYARLSIISGASGTLHNASWLSLVIDVIHCAEGVALDISEDAIKACKIFARSLKLREKYEPSTVVYHSTKGAHVLSLSLLFTLTLCRKDSPET